MFNLLINRQSVLSWKTANHEKLSSKVIYHFNSMMHVVSVLKVLLRKEKFKCKPEEDSFIRHVGGAVYCHQNNKDIIYDWGVSYRFIVLKGFGCVFVRIFIFQMKNCPKVGHIRPNVYRSHINTWMPVDLWVMVTRKAEVSCDRYWI